MFIKLFNLLHIRGHNNVDQDITFFFNMMKMLFCGHYLELFAIHEKCMY